MQDDALYYRIRLDFFRATGFLKTFLIKYLVPVTGSTFDMWPAHPCMHHNAAVEGRKSRCREKMVNQECPSSAFKMESSETNAFACGQKNLF